METITLTQEEIDIEIEKINNLTHIAMATRYRFSPVNDIYFDNRYPYCKVFMKRFNELGGFTPEISKTIGWKNE